MGEDDMKVTPGVSPNVYKDNIIEQKQGSAPKAGKVQRNEDSIQISGSAPERTTAQLVEGLKAQIMSDVKAGLSSHSLDALKREIASGEYDINPADIVYRLVGE